MSISSINNSNPTIQSQTAASAPTSADSNADGFFVTLWDTINPLQHIPVVSSAYRMITNTPINPVADVIGSTIYGGPIGAVIAFASEIGQSALGMGEKHDSNALNAVAGKAYNVASNNNLSNSAAKQTGTASGDETPQHFAATTQEWLKQGSVNLSA